MGERRASHRDQRRGRRGFAPRTAGDAVRLGDLLAWLRRPSAGQRLQAAYEADRAAHRLAVNGWLKTRALPGPAAQAQKTGGRA